jgi:predicted signal transduction protein with EAL and GGDEF domain
VSIGIACGLPSANVDDLTARADAALYRAKANGRNRVEAADEAVAGVAVVPAAEKSRGRAQKQRTPLTSPIPNLAVPLFGPLSAASVPASVRG